MRGKASPHAYEMASTLTQTYHADSNLAPEVRHMDFRVRALAYDIQPHCTAHNPRLYVCPAA